MELQGEDGSIVHLSETLPKDLGRGPGFAPRDRSVSRKQVLLQVQRISASNSHFHFTLSIEVVGPNPICVIHASNAGDTADVQVEIVKPGTQSALTIGDKFSLSIQEPVFYTLRDLVARIDSAKCSGHNQAEGADSLGIAADADEEERIAEAVARWQRRKQERFRGAAGAGAVVAADHCERVGVDLSKQIGEEDDSRQMLVADEPENPENPERSREKEDDTDGAKRFGFIVEGSEFERYGKKAHDTSKWDWQIGKRPGNDNDDDEDEGEGGGLQQNRTSAGLKKNPKPKSKPRNEDDDDDWRGDSEGEKELLAAGKRPPQARKNGPASHDLATTSETRVDARKKRKIASPTLKVSRQGTASKSTKIASKRGSRASKDEEEDDDDGEDLDGFLVDDVDEEDEAVGDEEGEWTDEDEDEEAEKDDEIEEDPPAGPQAASDNRGMGRGSRGDDRPLCKYGNKCFRKNKDHLAEFRH